MKLFLVLASTLSLFGNLLAGTSYARQDLKLSKEQAISWLRKSKYVRRGTEFRVLREIMADPESKALAEEALDEAHSRHFDVSDRGLFLSLLHTGGFSIAEYIPTTTEVVGLYIVTLGSDGRPEIMAVALGDELRLESVAQACRAASAFAEEFLNTFPLRMEVVIDQHLNGVVPTYLPEASIDEFKGQIVFSVPAPLASWANANEQKRAGVLAWSDYIWVLRQTLSKPYFAASPAAAEEEARREVLLAIQSFVVQEGHEPAYAEQLSDLETFTNAAQLEQRMAELQRLNIHLEKLFGSLTDDHIYHLNVQLCTVVTSLLSGTLFEKDSLAAATLPDIGTDWAIVSGDEPRLLRIARVLP